MESQDMGVKKKRETLLMLASFEKLTDHLFDASANACSDGALLKSKI